MAQRLALDRRGAGGGEVDQPHAAAVGVRQIDDDPGLVLARGPGDLVVDRHGLRLAELRHVDRRRKRLVEAAVGAQQYRAAIDGRLAVLFQVARLVAQAHVQVQ